MSVRSLNGLSSVFVNTIQAGDAINVSSSGSSISTINVDISKQSAKTTPANADLFLLEEADGSIKKITFQNLESNIDTNFWTYSSPSLYPINTADNVLIGTTTNSNTRKLLVNGTAQITGNIYLNTISTGTWNGSVLGKSYLPTDTVYDADIASFITASSTNTLTNKTINSTTNIIKQFTGNSSSVITTPSSTGTLSLTSDIPNLTTAENLGTALSKTDPDTLNIGTGGNSSGVGTTTKIDAYNIQIGELVASGGGNSGSVGADNITIQATQYYTGNPTINITAQAASGVVNTGAQVNITSKKNGSGTETAKITMVADTEIVMNTGFKINSSGTITAVGSKITNGFIDTGIADNKLVEIDTPSSTVVDNDYAKFTANGLEGRSYSEVKTDLSLNNVENTAISTFTGSSNITTVGTISSGTWNGTGIAANYGGTGFQTYTVGDILYANTTTTLTKLAIGGNTTFLMSNGTNPLWGSGYSFDAPLQINSNSVSLGNLSGWGTNNQILATNGSDAIEYRTLIAGTNISIGATSSNITISSSENYWERDSNISSFDIKTTSTVNNIALTVPFATTNTFTTSNTFVSTSSLKSTLGLISGSGEHIKFTSYSGTNPLGVKGIINSSTQRTYHFEFTHDSTGSAYPLLGQDINGNLLFHWNGQGDKFTFKSNGDSLMSGIISPTSANNECFLAFGSAVLTNTFHRTDLVKLKVAPNSSYAAGTEPGYIELTESATGGTSSNTTRLYFNVAGSAYIFWDGTNLINTPSFAPSDMRLKKNETLANTVELSDAFDNIEIYKYQYEEQYAIDKGTDPNKYVYGFIAQNVKENTDNLSSQFSSVGKGQAIYPNDKIDYEGDKLEVDNVLTINKTDMNLLLWGKIKEMDAIIKNQQIVINNLLSATTFANFKKM